MRGKLDPSRLILNHFHQYIDNPVLNPIIRIVLKAYWQDIEAYLTDVRKIYALLWQNPKLRPILVRREAIEYLNYAVSVSYKRLYEWIWFNKNPYR